MKAKLMTLYVKVREFVGNILLSRAIDEYGSYISEHGTYKMSVYADQSFDMYNNGEISIWQLHRELKQMYVSISETLS